MKLLICLVMLVSTTAGLEDMRGKVFSFPQKSNHFYVKLNAVQTNFSGITVCHRTFTDLQQSHSFFSLTTPDVDEYAFQTSYNGDTREMSVWVKSVRADFPVHHYRPNTWNSICSTWNSGSGVVQLWMNGRPFTPQYLVEFPLNGAPHILLGQEQDKYGATTGFLSSMSFMGMMADVHMWDSVIPACEIRSYMAQQSFSPGNVLDWAELDFQTNGRVIVHKKQTSERCEP